MSAALQLVAADPKVPAPIAARPQKLIGGPAICLRLGISRHTWHRWVVSREAPAPVPNIPGHPRWAVSDIERFERGRHWQGAR